MHRYTENGNTIVVYSPEELAAMPALTDWDRVKGMTDEELTAAALADPDSPPYDGDDRQSVALGRGREALRTIMPEEMVNELLKPRGRPKALQPKELVSMRFSPEVLQFFRSGGKGWQTRIDTALREYVNKQL